MSGKLISADELEKAFNKYKPNGEDLATEDMWIDLWTELVQAPAVDAVEVVRCKNCEYYHQYHAYKTKEATGWGKCTLINMDIDMTVGDYCSHGERREENAVD